MHPSHRKQKSTLKNLLYPDTDVHQGNWMEAMNLIVSAHHKTTTSHSILKQYLVVAEISARFDQKTMPLQLQSSAPWEGHSCRAGSDILHAVIAP